MRVDHLFALNIMPFTSKGRIPLRCVVHAFAWSPKCACIWSKIFLSDSYVVYTSTKLNTKIVKGNLKFQHLQHKIKNDLSKKCVIISEIR